MRATYFLLLAALLLAGVLSGFYVWGEWVAGLVMFAFAALTGSFWVRRESKQQPVSPGRLAVVFIGFGLASSVPVLIGYVIGLVMHGRPPS